ncbi:unnamed protein product [Oikopleura dioica]|uniref:Phospholipid scramblase n=1 Tax=Oikopleura dioica TaxID=34765 RepID=E4WTJ3_OIKDI|nr:unnamed protein product [Oikopleura dioica]
MAPAYGQASPQGYAPPPQGYASPQQGPPAYAQAPTPPQAPAPAQAPPAPIIINIQQNASGFNWAPPPAPAAVSQANCPPGMEYFLGINSITVHQKVSCSENCSSLCCPCIAPCVHEGNEYTLLNEQEQALFELKEMDNCGGMAGKICAGANRGFNMIMTDGLNRVVCKLNRKYKCRSAFCNFFPCTLQEVEITDGNNNPIGFIKQSASMFEIKYEICTPTGVPTLKIKQQRGLMEKLCPACTSSVFPLTSYDGKNSIGAVTKEQTCCELCSGEQQYKVQFPADLDVKMKATVMAASILIDYLYFETGAFGVCSKVTPCI